PSQPVVTNSAWQLILAQIALTTSMSKPTIWPVAGSMLSIGGDVVSDPTFKSLPPRSAAWTPPAARTASASVATNFLISSSSTIGAATPGRHSTNLHGPAPETSAFLHPAITVTRNKNVFKKK